MDTLVYGALMSLDGYTVDAGGNFDWAAPDAEVHAFVNDLERDTGTYLYGRRMYEVTKTVIPWAHLDIAGPANNGAGGWGFTGKGPTGVSVRALIEFATGLGAK